MKMANLLPRFKKEIAGISLISRGKPRAQLVARKEAIRSKKKHIFRSHDDAILAPQRVQEPKKCCEQLIAPYRTRTTRNKSEQREKMSEKENKRSKHQA
jgi:hypothetical protein